MTKERNLAFVVVLLDVACDMVHSSHADKGVTYILLYIL